MTIRQRTSNAAKASGPDLRDLGAWSAMLFAAIFAVDADAQQLLIDDFATHQATLVVNPGPASQVSSVASGSSMGGGRVLRVSASAGATMSGSVSGGLYSFTCSGRLAGTSEMWWDGDADTNFKLGFGAVSLPTG